MNYWSHDVNIIRNGLLTTSGLSFKSPVLPLASMEYVDFFYMGSKGPSSQLHRGQPDPRFMGLYSAVCIFLKIASRFLSTNLLLLNEHLLSCRCWVSPRLRWSCSQDCAKCIIWMIVSLVLHRNHHRKQILRLSLFIF